MTYSIIETNHDEVVSTHPTRKEAQDTLHEMCHVREYIGGRYETKTTTAALHHRVRNDATGAWVEVEDLEEKLGLADYSAELRKLIEQGGYSQRAAAKELQISERMMRYYCAGEQPVPRVVMLAMRHLVHCPPHD